MNRTNPPPTSAPTSPVDPTPPDPTAPSAPSLGAQAARGAVWATAPAVLAKVTGFVADIALAWFLSRAEFGLVGLAVAVAAFFGVIQQAGLRDILTQRQKRFLRWATPGFWLAMTLGVICSAAMAASAPLAARLFDAPQLTGLVYLMSARCLLDALAIVPQAKLQIELRYRAIGAVAAMCTLVQAGLSVVLASKWVGWGPYAMCAPMVLTSALQAAAFWWLARPHVRTRVELPRWRWLGRDAGFAMATGLVSIAVGYGDNAILGIFRDEEVVGLYFFAYRLAVQANQLIVTNLSSVLFSALSQLEAGSRRQIDATLSAARILSVVAMPLNCIQAAAAEPIFRVLYQERWLAAVLPFQLLSIAMALALIGAPSTALMRSQGRFGFYFGWASVVSGVYLILTGIGAWAGGATGVAACALVHYAVFGIAGLRVAVGRVPGFWRRALPTCLLPLVLALVAGALAIASRRAIPGLSTSDVLGVAWIVLVSGVVYGALVRLCMPEAWEEMLARIRSMAAARRRPGRGSA